MIQLIQFTSFWLISVSTESVYGSTYAVMGDYQELNPKDCGITRITEGYEEMCFDWNRNSVSEITSGRNATMGEVPWIVGIGPKETWRKGKSKCTGSLIADKWIITTKLCGLVINGLLAEKKTPWVIYGHESFRDRYYLESIKNVQLFPEDGINLALFELRAKPQYSRSICLPRANITIEKPEYALNAGWGEVNRNKHPLQMGYKLLLPLALADINSTLKDRINETNLFEKVNNMSSLIFTRSINNHAINCEGDTGSPLWQYHNGRAILIGLASLQVNRDPNDLCDKSSDALTAFTSTSNEIVIDWIKNVTKLN